VYEAVHARPDGDSTAARQVRTASRHGYDGVVVRTRTASVPVETADRYGVDVVDAATVRADDPRSASGGVANFRPDHTLLVVAGGTPELNRFAVEQPRVDVLAAPTPGDDDVPFNHVLARAAARNGVRVEFDFGPVLRSSGGRRVRAIRALRRLHELVEQYDAPHVASASPHSHLGVRAPRELAAVGEAVGIPASFVREGLAEWGRLAERNRDRASDDYVMPGVWRGRPDGTGENGGMEGSDPGEPPADEGEGSGTDDGGPTPDATDEGGDR
jgi:ribonuclease P/MRP protein subunit RPP1